MRKFVSLLSVLIPVRGSDVADHVARNCIATDIIPMDRTDVMKLVAEDLAQEEERTYVNILICLQRMKDRSMVERVRGKNRVPGW